MIRRVPDCLIHSFHKVRPCEVGFTVPTRLSLNWFTLFAWHLISELRSRDHAASGLLRCPSSQFLFPSPFHLYSTVYELVHSLDFEILYPQPKLYQKVFTDVYHCKSIFFFLWSRFSSPQTLQTLCGLPEKVSRTSLLYSFISSVQLNLCERGETRRNKNSMKKIFYRRKKQFH